MRLPATVLLLSNLFFASVARCQPSELIIQGQTGKLYLEHTVVAKENWYSVGRLYNLNPKVLAPYNHRTLEQPLIIGQTLEIPLTATNFSQTGAKTPAETLVPVYHVVQEKEWMYRISVNHNKVPIPMLEKWNHINGDQLHPGLPIIVGFLKVRTALSALATHAVNPLEVASTSPPAPAPAVHQAVSSSNETPVQALKTDSNTGARTHPHSSSPAPVTAPVQESTAGVRPATGQESPSAGKPAPVIPNAPHFDGGVFRSDFSDEGHSVNGEAGVFKSTSGWQDGKYYALMNNVNVGTIVKVTDPSTGKSVYTKVLGQLPDMKESAGLTIRISNAAAAELGQVEGKFAVQVLY
jgi:hypothetical protein